MTAVDWLLEDGGWRFGHNGDEDEVNGKTWLREVFTLLTCQQDMPILAC